MERLAFQILDSSISPEGHSHKYAHILLPLSETLTVRYLGKEYPVSPKELCFVPPNTFHHCHCPSKITTMNIPASMIQQSDLTELSRQIIYSVRNEVYPLLNLIRLEVRENPNSASIQHLFYYLYGKMIEKNEYASLQYIRTHYHEDISIHQLAQLENYTPAYFVKWFRDKTGCSPSAYLRRFRVERAKALLGSTSYSILEIALLVGYNSHAALSRAFRTVTGITPQEYRKSVSRI